MQFVKYVENWSGYVKLYNTQGGLKSNPLPSYEEIVLNRIKACQ